MPNRLIKESICTSQNLNELSPEEEIFFYRLIVNCDDYGRMDARPAILRARCFPLRTDSIKEAIIIKWLQCLAGRELLDIYEINGQRYLQIKTWENHQQIRAKRSKYPDPNGNMIASEIIGNQSQASDSNSPRNPIQSESNPNPIQVPDFIDKELWNDFLDMRKKIRKSPTDRAKELLIKDLEKLKSEGYDPNEILKQSIKNSWAAVFPLKGEYGTHKRVTANRAATDEEFNDPAASAERERIDREITGG